MIIHAAYAVYVVATIAIFAVRPPRQAVLIASMLGWLLLPVAVFPQSVIEQGGLTMEIIGIALPSRLLLTKAIVVAVTVFGCLVVKAPRLFAQLRFTLSDVAMALFCLSPMLASIAAKVSLEQGCIQTAYLVGVWGCTWITGRLALADEEGQRGLATAIMTTGLCLLVPALLEGIWPAWLYNWLYGPHPFARDGVVRYLGFRPLAFFEHGNQYGMWISMAALVSVHDLVATKTRSVFGIVVAVLLATAAVASQSIGAILLLIGGAWLTIVSPRAGRALLMATAMIALVGGAAYVSGRLPLRSWALETPSGQAVRQTLNMVNRGSFGWRVQRDQIALPLIHKSAVAGYGTWDWWRPLKSHPWGLPLLIAGQFGLFALAFATFALLFAPIRDLWRGTSTVLGLIVVLSVIDAWLNSAAYIPAILASAALAAPIVRRSPDAEPQAGSTE